jgi:menaquinone-dependent protoporphyrinogen oxidase
MPEEELEMRALVTYASRSGSTAEIAARIADRIRAAGIDTDCVSVSDGPLVSSYDAFVVGSSVYVGRWEKDARAFVDAHGAALAEHPTWLFSSGPLGTEPTLENGEDKLSGAVAATELEALTSVVHPRGHAVFFGAFDPGVAALGVRMFRLLPAGRKLLEEGDFRDWPAIEAWADEIAASLAERRTSVGTPVGA